jgi:toxin CptA
MFPLPLTLIIRPSRQLLLGLVGLHGMALAASWLAHWPMPFQVLLSMVLLASASFHLRPRQTVILRCQRDGQLAIQADNTWVPVTPTYAQVLLPFLTLLRYRFDDKAPALHLLVLPDCLTPEDFRRLRVWLRWKAKPARTAELGPEP